MDNRTVIYKLGVFALAGTLALQSCKPKINEIDNNQVISKPYSLYVGDSSGTILNTNEGYNYKYVTFNGGVPTTSIITAGNNLLFFQRNLHVIENSLTGNNSNPTYTRVTQSGIGQSIMLYWAKYKRVYVGSRDPNGLVYSEEYGAPDTWRPVNDPDFTIATNITSLIELKDGKLIAYDDINKETYRLTDIGSQWKRTTGGSKLPNTGQFFLTHKENTVIAVDATGNNGAFFSVDDGANWNAYGGLPPAADGVKYYSACSAFDQTVLIGSTKGVFRLDLESNAFKPANIGILANAIIFGLTAKEDYYKNNRSKKYVYAATNKGIFRSEDFGDNWVLVKEGNFVSAY